ncbi:MAG: glycosyltransferase [Planctomycetota bacterium]|nr:glycosyltransferase [Planctomycetota bacterium]
MNRSLSVLLPVHNAQATLESDVTGILDIVPELSSQFELWIVDDASHDGTWEVANELSRRYPQVKAVRQPARRGAAVAIQAAIKRTDADAVVVHDGQSAVDPDEIVRLLRSEGGVRVASRSPASLARSEFGNRAIPAPRAMQRFSASERRELATIATQRQGSFQLLCRPAIEELRGAGIAGQATAQNRSTRSDLPISAEKAHGTPRPNFLSKVKQSVKDFTLGE